VIYPPPGEVLHFSEDPNITEFVPHVAVTAQQPEAYVWAVDAYSAPSYWFPRECPRAMAWPGASSTSSDVARLLGSAPRVHAIEYGWLEAMRTVRLYAYRFPASVFSPFGGEISHAHVASVSVRPLGPAEPVGDLFEAHAAAGIELRVMVNMWPWWGEVIGSSLEFSGIRLRNALPA